MDGVLSQEEINALLNNPGASSDTADGQLSDSEKTQSVKLLISVWVPQQRHCFRW